MKDIKYQQIPLSFGRIDLLSIRFNLFWLIAALAYAMLFLGMGLGQLSAVCFCATGGLLACQYLLRSGKIYSGRIMTLLVLNGGIFIMDLLLGRNLGMFMLFIPVMASSFILFGSHEQKETLLMTAVSIVLILLLEITNHEFILKHYPPDKFENNLIFYSSLVISVVATGYVVYYLRQSSQFFEKKLQLQQTFFEDVFNKIPTDLVVFDPERRYIYLNPAAVKDPEIRSWMIGKTEAEYLAFRKKTKEFAEVRETAFREVLANRKVVEFEESITDKEGITHHFIRRMNPVMDEEGNISFVIGYGIEITPQKEAQFNLIHAKLVAEKAARAKTNFLSNVSHEIRTPLNAIVGLSNLLLHDPRKENLEENLRIISNSSDTLLALINNILDLSKIEEGTFSVVQASFSLHDLLSQLDRSIRVQTDAKGLKLKSSFDPKIPAYLSGDALRLKQVLLNVIFNAVKFTEKGSVNLTVAVKKQEDQQLWIEFMISDTGIGIPAGKKELIFESFTQAEPYVTRKYEGSGLGLNISRKLCELMGGGIMVESEAGKGSIFTILLPFGTPMMVSPVTSTETSAPSTDVKSYSILMAEDNVVNQKLALQLFSKWDIRLDIASNGLEALDKISDNNYDLVLMDLQMPEMDGITAMQKIRSGEAGDGNKSIPVIAITADVFDDIRKKAEAHHFNDFITKPYNNTDLYNKIMYCIQQTKQ